MATTYRVIANFSSNAAAVVSTENVYTDEDAAVRAFSRVRGAAATISASLMREREFDGQIETVVLDLAMSEGL